MCDPESTQSNGEDGTVLRLLPAVYEELRRLASHYLDSGRHHTLQPTALVHEAYLKLATPDRRWAGRDHFLATAARAMRQILVDHARRRNADKRGGGAARVSIELSDVADLSSDRECGIADLDGVLTRLAVADPRAAHIAELRLFGGMTHEAIASVLDVSRTTVLRDWQFARAWLATELNASSHGDDA